MKDDIKHKRSDLESEFENEIAQIENIGDLLDFSAHRACIEKRRNIKRELILFRLKELVSIFEDEILMPYKIDLLTKKRLDEIRGKTQ